MDVIGAFECTLDTAIVEDAGGGGAPDGTSLEHLRGMLRQMMDTNMPPDKQNRWLGWAQGVLTAQGCLSLEQCKEINAMFS